MKKDCVAICFLGLLLAGCSDSKRTQTAEEDVTADTTAVVSADSLWTDSLSAEGEVMPAAADELFDDFFFNYASNRSQQLERTVFPLPVVNGEDLKWVKKNEWRMEPFFIKDDYYTLIFDSQKQMARAADTTIIVATVERFNIPQSTVERFVFTRKSGCWMLHEIHHDPLQKNANAHFLKFYERFATDSLFQHESLSSQIQFSGPDPDDDFSTIDGVITPDFWEGFRPDLPHGKLYNIVYGRQDPVSLEKIFLLRGINSGIEVGMTFKLKKGRWRLTKLNS